MIKIGQNVVHAGDFVGCKGSVVDIRDTDGYLPVMIVVEWEQKDMQDMPPPIVSESVLRTT